MHIRKGDMVEVVSGDDSGTRGTVMSVDRKNGKSVIVVINDRGAFVPGHINDLDKVAFDKIASVGAGVINVKMEEIIN